MTHQSSFDNLSEPYFRSGDSLVKYRIERLLGYGGMGEVYLATHTLLNRACALKILPPLMAERNPNLSRRFLREAKLASQFKHPNVVEIWDVGEDASTGVKYIVMEYVQGKTLAEWLEHGIFTESETLQIATKVAAVLEMAQQLSIVHRDIKPSNIMLDEHGTVKVTDLGIAKGDFDQTAADSSLTALGALLGTPFYAAPEQCRAASEATTKSDIYSLGATMYHMLTGEKPYSGENPVAVMAAVLEKIPTPVHKINPLVSQGTSRLISRMMEKKPEKRPANPTELIQALHVLQHSFGAKIAAQAKSAINALRRKTGKIAAASRRHWRKITAAALSMLLCLIIVGLGVNFKQARDAKKQATLNLDNNSENLNGNGTLLNGADADPDAAANGLKMYQLPAMPERPLTWRLANAQQRLANLEKELHQANTQLAQTVIQRKILFRKRQILALGEQQAHQEETLTAASNRDLTATKTLLETTAPTLAKTAQTGADLEQLQQLLLKALQQAPNADPNFLLARLTQQSNGEQSNILPLLGVTGNNAPPADSLLAAMLLHSVDVNLIPPSAVANSLQSSSTLLAAILSHGLEDVDGPATKRYLLSAMRLPAPAAEQLCHNLLFANCLVNIFDLETGNTPLHLAVTQNRLDLAILLICADANVNAVNNNGQTPLHLSQLQRNPAMQSLLLAALTP